MAFFAVVGQTVKVTLADKIPPNRKAARECMNPSVTGSCAVIPTTQCTRSVGIGDIGPLATIATRLLTRSQHYYRI